jgi:hypothetical protein
MDPSGRLISFASCAIDWDAFLSLSISAKQKLRSAANNMFSRENYSPSFSASLARSAA